MKREKSFDQFTSELAAGRSLDDQIEHIKKCGDHSVPSVLRVQVLESLGIPKPKQSAENLLVFGCYSPFIYGSLLSDYIKLLDILGVDYTYLEEELSCCGAPMITASHGPDREKAIKVGKESAQRNIKMAQLKGAKTIFHFCSGCTHMNKSFFSNDPVRHIYLLDPIVDKLGGETLKIAAPKTVGYFEGCHSTYRAIVPEVRLEWTKYRQFLGKVENLRIVDLPNNECCKKHPERIVEKAQKQNLDTIVCPCNGCYHRIGIAGKGRVQVKHFVEIVLSSLKGK